MLTFAKNDLSPLKTISYTAWDGSFKMEKETFDPYSHRLKNPAYPGGPIVTGKSIHFLKDQDDGCMNAEELAVVRQHLDQGTIVYVNYRQYTHADLTFIYEGTKVYNRYIAEIQDSELLAEIEAITAPQAALA